MFIFVLLFLILATVVLLAAIAALFSGVCLGVNYLYLLSKRLPLPAWTIYIRIGWYVCATGVSSLLTFQGNFVLYLSSICLFATFAIWLLGLNEWHKQRTGKTRPVAV